MTEQDFRGVRWKEAKDKCTSYSGHFRRILSKQHIDQHGVQRYKTVSKEIDRVQTTNLATQEYKRPRKNKARRPPLKPVHKVTRNVGSQCRPIPLRGVAHELIVV